MRALADTELSKRILTLVELSERFGPVFPCYGVVKTDTGWGCECGSPTCNHRVGKHPHITKWQTRATKSPEQIAKWAAKWPAANWAIVTGIDIDVVDLDAKPGKPSGIVTLACWEDCDSVSTPDSTRVTTGTGQHIYFATGSGLRTTNNPDGTGIDVKSTGGYVMAPGSRHEFGEVYQIDLDEGLEACPAWLVERIFPSESIPSPDLDNQNPDTSLFTGGSVVWEGGFQVRPAARLTAWEFSRIEQFCIRNPKFAATWDMDRACRYPFRCGRDSVSEYEGALAFYFRRDGWDAQQIMDGISTWRRKHDLAPRHHSRYRSTIGKAIALVQVSPMETVAPKGLYKHGATKARVLATIQDGPRKPKEIVAELGLNPACVWKTLGRLVKDGQILHVGHEYLAAPPPEVKVEVSDEVEVTTPADAEVDLDALEAEYAAAVAAGMFEDAFEEEIEAPEMYTRPRPAVIKATPTDFDLFLDLEPEPEPEPVLVSVTQPIPAPVSYAPFETRKVYAERAAAWEVQNKIENRKRLREHRKRENYQSPSALRREAQEKRRVQAYLPMPSPADEALRRINDMTPQEWAARDNGDDPF